MDIKAKVEEGLRNYKKNKCRIESTLRRIEVYEELLKSGEDIELFIGESKELGMPRSNTNSISSIVELRILSQEDQRETLKQWIKDDKSRIYPLQIEKEQIDGALNSLTEREKYIVECKNFEDMFWREIEISFNDKYRQQNIISEEGLRKIYKASMNTIILLLSPYYARF